MLLLTLLGIEHLFSAGFKEFARSRKSHSQSPSMIIDSTHRAMRVALSREVDSLETHLPFMATVGSISPYIGLFGTVWGIMNSFQQIGATGSANLAVVAPGISEALIATAVGLAAAIPAVVAYNHFVNQIRRQAIDMDCFIQDFLNIVQRGLMTEKPDKKVPNR
mgnify:CR=1 FL=1